MRPSALSVYVKDLPVGEKSPEFASHFVSVTQVTLRVEISSTATFWYPPLLLEVISNAFPSGDREEAKFNTLP